MIHTTKFPLELSHSENFLELSSHRKLLMIAGVFTT